MDECVSHLTGLTAGLAGAGHQVLVARAGEALGYATLVGLFQAAQRRSAARVRGDDVGLSAFIAAGADYRKGQEPIGWIRPFPLFREPVRRGSLLNTR
ncbi:hypothetical protein Nans01_40560 [Nocardiopsis ansamitocini]|uniref:Uncharacterized protein n=1 Tax=Nocardiopsis ansamitocini TaxID=1670832 RepID=A0A9W6P8T3_9ACTN|nr:hypothetical protein Nans01_40560 [Nocardiopsis ansamitocini]